MICYHSEMGKLLAMVAVVLVVIKIIPTTMISTLVWFSSFLINIKNSLVISLQVLHSILGEVGEPSSNIFHSGKHS